MTRQDPRHPRNAMFRALFGSSAQPAGPANPLTQATKSGIWTRPGLSIADRLIGSISHRICSSAEDVVAACQCRAGRWPDRHVNLR